MREAARLEIWRGREGRLSFLVFLFFVSGGVFKRKKGIWWMPWRMEAMKDVARCDKLRGVVSKL